MHEPNFGLWINLLGWSTLPLHCSLLKLHGIIAIYDSKAWLTGSNVMQVITPVACQKSNSLQLTCGCRWWDQRFFNVCTLTFHFSRVKLRQEKLHEMDTTVWPRISKQEPSGDYICNLSLCVHIGPGWNSCPTHNTTFLLMFCIYSWDSRRFIRCSSLTKWRKSVPKLYLQTLPHSLSSLARRRKGYDYCQTMPVRP